eukprot:UN21034
MGPVSQAFLFINIAYLAYSYRDGDTKSTTEYNHNMANLGANAATWGDYVKVPGNIITGNRGVYIQSFQGSADTSNMKYFVAIGFPGTNPLTLSDLSADVTSVAP